jgi:thiol-disulfide isomerase/thioredoxin
MNKRIAFALLGLLACTGWPALAIDYTLPDLDGRLRSLEQYRGKWVIVNYWATWCGTCRKELPDLASLHEAHRDGDIVVVGINFEDIDPKGLQAFVARQGIPYPVLRAEPTRRTPLGPVPALPTTYILDPGGRPVAGEVGLVTRQDLEDHINARRGQSIHP